MLLWNWYRTCSNYSEAAPNMRNTTTLSRFLLISLVSGSLVGQQQRVQPKQPPAQPPPQDDQLTIIRTTVEEVTAPVLVFDRDGNFVNCLQPPQVHLFDNGKDQNI